jgi:cysteine desulfurase
VNHYFDHNATTQLSPAAREAYLEASAQHWHNPSSLYREAAAARRALEDAREELAEILGAEPGRIIFNSGATEGSNAIFRHFAGKRVALSAVEHPCVTEAAEALTDTVAIPCNPAGVTEYDTIPTDAQLVSIMAANNENGVLQPWRESLSLCQARGVPFHCDASQWLGKLPATGLGSCDFLTATAHKFGGPKGVGFLLVSEEEADDFNCQRGGPQENGHRAGTEDYPAVAAMLAALREAGSHTGDPAPRDGFEQTIGELLPGTKIVGEGAARLWNTCMLILPDHKNLKWLTRLSARGICVSTGSACSAGRDNPSRVLLAMGYGYEEMSCALRISSGAGTTADDWQDLATALLEINTQLDGGQSNTLGKISLTDL